VIMRKSNESAESFSDLGGIRRDSFGREWEVDNSCEIDSAIALKGYR
jgi:hypothetical protein